MAATNILPALFLGLCGVLTTLIVAFKKSKILVIVNFLLLLLVITSGFRVAALIVEGSTDLAATQQADVIGVLDTFYHLSIWFLWIALTTATLYLMISSVLLILDLKKNKRNRRGMRDEILE